jgi:hypothetical protein
MCYIWNMEHFKSLSKSPLLIVLFLLTATLLISCNSGSNDTPEETVAAYFEAIGKKSCSEMAALFLSEKQAQIETSCNGWSDERLEKMVDVYAQGWKIKNIQMKDQDGSRKTDGHDCRVVVLFPSNGYATSFYLENVSGDWKIADVE